MLVDPNPGVTLAIFSDASDHAVRAALKQFVDGAWQSLDFFSEKLSPDESKYGAYDRELFAIYLAVKHFRHMVEGRSFTIYTDYKPITYAFRKKCSPQQFRHLYFISQFTIDIRHISGEDNIVADALYRMVERLYRQLKAAIMYQQNVPWVEALSTILLGIRSAWKEDLQGTVTEMLYDQSLRLPGEFLGSHRPNDDYNNPVEFMRELYQHIYAIFPLVMDHDTRKGKSAYSKT